MDVRIDKGIGWVILNNPNRLNSMSMSMWRAMDLGLRQFDHDDAVRCIVVTGAGSRAFCAGADISEFEQHRSERETNLEYDRVAKAAINRLQGMEKPTLAMISGYCIGGGVGLAISCDIRLGAAGSRYGIPAAKLGLGYDFPGLKRLVSLVGPSRAKQIIFTAEQCNAEKALRVGLIDECVADAELEAATLRLAAAIAGNAPLTIAAAKYCADLATRIPIEADLAEARRRVELCFDSSDFVEGRRAFMEKRKPAFQGK